MSNPNDNVGPFPVAAAIARLKTLVPMLKLVGNAADLKTALDAAPPVVPAAYVVITEQGDSPIGMSGGVLVQKVRVAVALVNFVRNYANEGTGSSARADMDALIAAERAAMLCWKPAGNFLSLSFQAARDETFKAGLLCSQEIYRTEYRLRLDQAA